jgi:DNA-directed RNA polymerase subunit N (RpoN/RPB10)
VSDHFADVSKVIEAGKGAQHEVPDLKLTRYASRRIGMSRVDTNFIPLSGCHALWT